MKPKKLTSTERTALLLLTAVLLFVLMFVALHYLDRVDGPPTPEVIETQAGDPFQEPLKADSLKQKSTKKKPSSSIDKGSSKSNSATKAASANKSPKHYQPQSSPLDRPVNSNN